MAAIEIKYFNSFVLKKTVNDVTADNAAYKPVFPGLPNNPDDYPNFGARASSNLIIIGTGVLGRNWIIEEARIRGGYNNTSTSYGPRAYLIEDSNDQSVRTNALIYSGVFNSRTELNETNVFSVGEQITKAVDPNYGSIQKIHALDSNLAIFQENKVSNALIDKDAIYSAEGSGTVTSTKLVIGQITPYVGEYGISKNPESFAYFGYRRYFTDKYRNAVMRLSRDGLTEISRYGMTDYFRDEFSEINSNFKQFIFKASISGSSSSPAKLVVGLSSDLVHIEKGMIVSIPQSGGGSISASIVGIVNTNTLYLSNDPGTPDVGNNAIFTKYIKDRIVGGYDAYNNNYTISAQNKSDSPTVAGFNRKENKYFANLINNSVARPGEIFFGDATTGVKGYFATVKVSTDATTDPGGAKELFAVSTEFVVSSR